MRIHQFVPAYHRGDAIGDEATHLKAFFRSRGFESEIYCLTRDEGLEGESRPAGDLPGLAGGDVVLFHYALPSPLTGLFEKLDCRKVLIHHNITPSRFFEGYSPELVGIIDRSREELSSLASVVDLALGDSEYNRRELESLGFGRSAVFPLFVDFARYARPHSVFLHDLLQDGRTNILFVGRVVPNKRIEDLIKVVFYFKKYIDPLVRLIVVGKTDSLPEYSGCLIRMADEFFLKPEEIRFTGHVTDAEMYALYKTSHVFLSMSEHEGFALPLIESMIFDLPIVAYESTAVPFTLDGAGVLFRRKRVDRVGELVRIVAADTPLRQRIIASQRERLMRFREADPEGFLLRTLEELPRE